MPRYIAITGGVLSGLGKGIASASIAKLLVERGFRVIPIKFDGYFNVDAGTMNPIEHGEVFVLEDGTECDMDLGTYERFLNLNLKGYMNITSGKIFKLIIEKERRGDYLGKTVQMVPHVTGEVKRWIKDIARKERAEIVLIEVGGTIGDIENAYFVEALRELALEEGKEKFFFIHVTLVPMIEVVGEQKTKPSQHSVKNLLELGIQPDMIICRCKEELNERTKEKLSLFCSVPKEAIISDHDVATIYEIPFLFEKQGVVDYILRKFGLRARKPRLGKLKKLIQNLKNPKERVRIVIAGEYTLLKDSYISILKSLEHAGMHLACKAELKWVESTNIEGGKLSVEKALEGCSGVIIPGGFGVRGVGGKIACIKFARERKIPFLGLCFGLQLAIVEFARNVCGLGGANSTEVDPQTPHPVIDLLPEQKGIKEKGGTMRLGSYPALLKEGSLVRKLYGKKRILERHRHRYEVNPAYHQILQANGMVFSGISPDKRLVEFIELAKHPFFIATQAHPEFTSRIEKPSPLFLGFLKACLDHSKNR
jgi:CTP synthase